MPKVSVIIPTYNCAKYINNAIESVLRQTYKDYEIIVIDDGSTDNTKDVLAPYIEKGLVRYIGQENRGLPGARNRGIKEARGEYIALLDADDEWPKMTLAIIMDELNKRKDREGIAWVITNRIRVEGNDRRIFSTDRSLENMNNVDLILKFLSEPHIVPEAMFFSKKVLRNVGLYDEEMKIYEDIDLHMRLFLNVKRFIYLPVGTYIYKIRGTSLTRENAEKRLVFLEKYLRKYEKVLLKLDRRFKDVLGYKWWDLGRQYWYLAKDWESALRCIGKSLSFSYRPGWEFFKKILGVRGE